MDLKMKQRWVGLLVVLALLAIFMPVISYKMESKRGIQLSTNIPHPPELPKIQVLANNSAQTTVPTQVAVGTNSPASAQTQLSPTSQSQSSAASQPQIAWASETRESASVSLTPQNPAANLTSLASQDSDSTPGYSSASKDSDPIPRHFSEPKKSDKIPAHSPTHVAHTITASANIGWAVQLGLFSNSKNIQHLLQTLSNQAIPTFEEKANAKSVRIFVGPLMTKAEAQIMKKRLQQELHIVGIIKRKTA